MRFTPRSVVDSVSELIVERGFIPISARMGDVKRPTSIMKNSGPITLHEAIRGALGMEIDDADVAYWEWQSIRELLNVVWRSLDLAAVSVFGNGERAITIATRQTTTADSIELILHTASIPVTPAVTTVTRRPAKPQGIPLPGKPLWAIIVTIGVLTQSVNSDIGDVLSSLVDTERTDEQLLTHLDDQIQNHGINIQEVQSLKSVVLLRALGRAFIATNRSRRREDLQALSLSQFLREMDESANWSGNSDSAILRRLTSISPETAEGPKKAIADFLAT